MKCHFLIVLGHSWLFCQCHLHAPSQRQLLPHADMGAHKELPSANLCDGSASTQIHSTGSCTANAV